MDPSVLVNVISDEYCPACSVLAALVRCTATCPETPGPMLTFAGLADSHDTPLLTFTASECAPVSIETAASGVTVIMPVTSTTSSLLSAREQRQGAK